MRRNLIIIAFIAFISLIFGSVIFFFVGQSNKEEIKLSGKITVLTDLSSYDAVVEAVANFKKIHNRIEINIVKDDNPYNKVIEEIKTAKVKEDITIVAEEYVKPLVEPADSPFAEVTSSIPSLSDYFSTGRLDPLIYSKKIYGVPWTSEPILIIYRSDIFSSEGINIDDIKTWDDFRDIGKNLIKGTEKKYLAYSASNFHKLNNALLSQLRLNYEDKENSKRVSDMINNMVYEGTLSGVDSLTDIAKSEGALAILMTPKDVYGITNVDSLKGKWGVMKVPAFEPGGNRDVSLGGYDILINKNTKNLDLSKEFSKYLSTDSNAAFLNLTKYRLFTAAYPIYESEIFNISNEYFNTNIWRIFSDVEKNSPPNKYK